MKTSLSEDRSGSGKPATPGSIRAHAHIVDFSGDCPNRAAFIDALLRRKHATAEPGVAAVKVEIEERVCWAVRL